MKERRSAVGHVSGRLTGIEDGDKVLCQCSCGNQKMINRKNFLSGNILSCGCLQLERLREKVKTHGMRDTKLYAVWCNMKQRCQNPKNKSYEYYGGKGIEVCEEWQNFEGFLATIPLGYSEDKELDRKNPSGNYCPDNCRWVDSTTQNFNKVTKLRGVRYCTRDNLWVARINKGKIRYQKYFKLKEDAEAWRREKELELYGEYSPIINSSKEK